MGREKWLVLLRDSEDHAYTYLSVELNLTLTLD